MYPLARAIPKEFLPVGPKPMLQFAIEEADAADVDEIILVVNETKERLIRTYFSNGDFGYADKFVFVEQEEPRGLADAILQTRGYLKSEPFLLLLPDNVFWGSSPSAVQLVTCFKEYSQNVIGLIEITENEAPLFGNCGKVELQRLKNDVFEIIKLADKEPGSFSLDGARRGFRTCARYILGPEFLSEADRMMRSDHGEFDDVPILQTLIQKSTMLGLRLDGKLFDCGRWEGYWAANRYYWEHGASWSSS